MDVHICEICGVQTTLHRQPDFTDKHYFLPPCCEGCGCGTYEEYKSELAPAPSSTASDKENTQ